MQRADSLEKTLMLGKIEGGRKRGQQRMRWLDGITNLTDMGLGGHGFGWTLGLDLLSPLTPLLIFSSVLALNIIQLLTTSKFISLA